VRAREGAVKALAVTAENWDRVNRPHDLLAAARRRREPTLRRLRLYATATCRAVWDQFPLPECQALIEAVEQYTEGECGWARVVGLRRALQQMASARAAAWQRTAGGLKAWMYAKAAGYCADNRPMILSMVYSLDMPRVNVRQSSLVRDIFANPFRTVACSKTWGTDTAVLLARQMYEWRDFGAMPILADALEDAGCDNEEILRHCRGPGPHVRGCWVVDLVLAKQ
jgi:hypothetical protein